jgi:hypothetical protein
MSKSILAILKELAVGFTDEAVFEACNAYIKQNKVKKPRAKSAWQLSVDEVYQELKKTNQKVKYTDATKEASRRKKIQQALDKAKFVPPLPKSRGTTEGWRTETNTAYPSDDETTEINVNEVD